MPKLINIALLLSFLVCYLEWGTTQSAFIFQTEYSIFFNTAGYTDSFKHPLILIPFAGQLFLLFTLFQRTPSRWLSLTGLILLGILVLFILLAGMSGPNLKITGSTLPFIVSTVFFFRQYRKRKRPVT